MFGTTRAGFGAAPHRNPAPHGIVVKQEPDERAGFQGMSMHPMVGAQAVPPLPVRTIYNYREATGRGNAAVFQPTQPAPVVKVERSEPRLCAAMNCAVILPMDYPHLRCRTCRARNVPRRPELSTVLTPAQLLARDRKYQVAPPLPSRVVPSLAAPGGHAPPPLPFRRPQPPPPPPPLPSRFRQPPPQAQAPGAQQVVPLANPSPSYPAPPVAVCKVDPDIDADIALQALLKPSSDDDGEADVIDLELDYLEDDLSYPDSGNATPTDVKPPPLPSRRTANPSLPLTVAQPASKRRKVSHASDPPPETNGHVASDSHAASIFAGAPPLPSRPKAVPTATAPPLPTRRPLPPSANVAASSSNSKTCSEPECQNALPATSPATRCMSCISEAWKKRRSPSAVETRPQQDGKKKAVSWADKNEEHDEFNFRETLRKHAARSSGSHPSECPDNEEGNIEGWDSDLTELSQSESEGEGNGEVNEDDGRDESSGTEEPRVQVPLTPIRTGLKIRIPPRSRSKSEGSSSTSTESRPSSLPLGTSPFPTSPVEADTANPPPPTSSPTPGEEGDNVSSTGQTTPTTTPDEPESEADNRSGVRICSGPRCNQTLEPGYHWKSCVVCRASARGYQRKRQNLQGRHQQLDLELEEHLKKSGTPGEEQDGDGTTRPLWAKLLTPGSKGREDAPRPSKPPPIKVDIEPFDDDDQGHNLIPGSRVCSARDCSFVVPPADEYPWKLCSRCRSRSKENHKSRSRRASSKKQAPPKEYRHEIAGPDALAMKRDDERCLSSDCGMLVGPQSKYPYCRQCRLQDWRLKRRNLRTQAILEAERAKTPSSTSSTPLSIKIPALRNRPKVQRPLVPPRPPTPYPEYKNLAGLLANFRKLAKNFFDAQTMHFAHQPPGTAPSLSIFIFDGEFTLVAPDFLVAQKRKAQVESTVASIQREVGTSAMLQYSERKWLTTFNHGIVTRFVCWRHPVRVRVPVPIPMPMVGSQVGKGPTAGGKGDEQGEVVKREPALAVEGNNKGKAAPATSGSEPDAQGKVSEGASQGEPQKFLLKEVLSYHRVMEGELEIAVFADKSHPFIPGERAVVRMRLVG